MLAAAVQRSPRPRGHHAGPSRPGCSVVGQNARARQSIHAARQRPPRPQPLVTVAINQIKEPGITGPLDLVELYVEAKFLPLPTFRLIGIPLAHKGHSSGNQVSLKKCSNDLNGTFPTSSRVTFPWFTIEVAPTASPPVARTSSTTFLTEPPVEILSSTTKALFPRIASS
jgi:hypothetical protein